jgi:NinB protein
VADHTSILRTDRTFAHRLVDAAPMGSVMAISKPKRTNDQNSLMWALLSEVSAAKPEGRELTPDIWKAVFMHSLDHAQRFEMALDGKGMVPVGFRSSRLTKAQFSDLIEVIHEYAARHGIQFKDAT